MNVTYLFGAGASAKSLPIVSNMKDRFSIFNDFISRYIDIPNKKAVEDLAGSLLTQIRTHASPDTYAKKLHLQEGLIHSSKKDLFILKHYLSLFFIAEQSAFYKNFRTESGAWPVPFPTVDARYDPFLATLLQKQGGKILLPKEVNIVSWNYDSQLELAYTAFSKCKLNDALALFNEIPSTAPLAPGGSVIKLNGTAGMYFDEDGKHPSHLLSDGKEEFDIDDFKSLLESFARLRPGLVGNHKDYKPPFINFAWEEDPFSRGNSKELISILNNTQILVIIGYSFPNFNRQVDRQLMKQMSHSLEKIYYQGEAVHLDSLIVRLQEGIMKHHNFKIDRIPLVKYTDIDQFCIPYEL